MESWFIIVMSILVMIAGSAIWSARVGITERARAHELALGKQRMEQQMLDHQQWLETQAGKPLGVSEE